VLKLKMVICEAYAKMHGWAPTVARICWCLLIFASFPPSCLILVCKSKVAVVVFKLCSVCWSALDLFWCIVEICSLECCR
jgi:hypothetical protein